MYTISIAVFESNNETFRFELLKILVLVTPFDRLSRPSRPSRLSRTDYPVTMLDQFSKRRSENTEP